MKKSCKFLSIIMALIMVISIIPMSNITSSAASGKCGDNLTWTFDNSTGTLTISGTGAMYDFSPSYSPWEYFEEKIQELIIDYGVTKIGNSAFAGCTGIKDVIIPETVTSIVGYAFHGCKSLVAVTIPNSIDVIEYYTFAYCDSLKSIIIPNSVKTIEDYAFGYCDNLEIVTMGFGLTTIGNYSFFSCEKLNKIDVNENNKCYSNDEYGVLFNKDKTILVKYPMGNKNDKYIIPSSVISIGDCAFYECKYLENFILPQGLRLIGNWSFAECERLTKISIPNSVMSIGENAFYGSANLTNVYYNSTEKNWNNISISTGNEQLLHSYVHYIGCEGFVESIISPTCTEWGYTSCTCHCGYSYRTNEISPKGHTYTEFVTNPTCTKDGYTTYTCECGDTYMKNMIPATGHEDLDVDAYCDHCDELLCDHDCHKGGITGFFWKITNFFNRIFGSNKTCSCGVAHY